MSVFAVPEAFGPEKIDAFEFGTKNTLMDGKVQLNATAFYYKYKGLQLSRIIAQRRLTVELMRMFEVLNSSLL